ncbi:family 10 glycosylhydrolase [Brachyspira hyodysenteriae]|uniref:glycoside hydrolase family 10 protein n=1 Tax=Brachyspira hyodysenteriae TaxID=159 RepID=UPI0022CD50B2|nr:family 10 glycosylhydrolase [Brachyspira hyodysenteriae]MCZ9838560.1 family 10 glycosylhydrolase [Brachyspira hyodysenteriae]MCZ9847861.1 family 10 glycosylhydrolase [Brachyspira hyodysenteriae]MCZ9891226.1 family 10 glycosylhydrolase [Brachyspira hyodysenteriae]MCZ9930861.1 family 10 glycosylhydrolase [Brachyspira hyodysenteriae]MCZ9988497.1 family 10 glycosylhydrolase [Brachyspira hyodysenteriae]
MRKLFIFIFLSIFYILSCQKKEIIIPDNLKSMLIKDINDDKSLNPLYREFRGAWFSTVNNMDWPLEGKSEEEQKTLALKYLDTLYNNNFNAVFVQVKPDAGVIFPSKINPTTRYFFGKDSTNETDDYPFKTDMLKFIIDEAHKRNLEVHAWFNPYRIAVTYDTNKSYAEQFSKKNFIHVYAYSNNLKPIHWYDNKLYLDPGEPISAKYVIDSIMEVVENYDIDGVHFDDYFYQNMIDDKTYKYWPDETSASKYASSQGYDPSNTNYDDYGVNGLYAWRRNNINTLVSSIYKEIKSRKPYVKWTISPAGVWRNKEKLSDYNGYEYGSDTQSYNPNFDALHADVLLWMLNGEKTESLKNATEKDGINKMYVDAIIPQIYWSDKHETAPFDIIADWWIEQAKKSTNGKLADLYVGHPLYKMGRDTNVEPWQDIDLMSKQVDYIRTNGRNYIKGSVFFTMRNMYKDDIHTKGFGYKALNYLKENSYPLKSIIPTMNTMKDLNTLPSGLTNLYITNKFSSVEITFTDSREYKTDKYDCAVEGTSVYYSIYRKDVAEDYIVLIDKIRRTNFNTNSNIVYNDKTANPKKTYIYYITALDRLHNESVPIMITNR